MTLVDALRLTKATKRSVSDNYFAALVNNVGTLAATRSFELFARAMYADINAYLSEAFYLGMQDCGVDPDEAQALESGTLQEIINNEMRYVTKLATAVLSDPTDIGSYYPRIEVWANRYIDTRNRARALTCGNQKLKWILGPTEQHCPSCSRLDGKVKRANEWELAGLHPQSPPNKKLVCGGWRCLCKLIKTDEPLSSGPLPMM